MRFILSIGIVFIVYLAYVKSDACVQCNSATDPRCATNPEQFMAKQCTNATSKCYTRVLNGDTIRGCASDLNNATAANCNNEMECLICTFMEGCNRAVFPQHRLSCMQCSGNYTGPCATNVRTLPVVCPIYKLGDSCYLRRDGRNASDSFQRGCLSSAQSKGLCKNSANCYTCDGVGCNFLEANSTDIPLARDSAFVYSASVLMVLAAFFVTRQS